MATTPRLQIPYQAAGDPPNGAGLGFDMAKWLDDRLAPADRACHVYWGNQAFDPSVANGNWTDIPNDTAILDPFNLRQADNVSFILPWAGRYSFYTRVSFTSNDSGNRYILCWSNVSNNADMAWQQCGPVIYQDVPQSIYTEEILTAGTKVRPRVFKDGNTAQWIRHNIGGLSRTQSIIRYLGPG